MRIDAIQNHSYIPNATEATGIWDLIAPVQEKPSSIIDDSGFYRDTLNPSEKINENYFRIDDFPVLEQPKVDPKDHSKVRDDLMNSLYANENNTEHLLFRLYIACMQTQQDLREETSLFVYDSIKRYQAGNKKVMEEYFNHQDDIIKQAETSKTLNWVSLALGGLAGVGVVASIVATILSSGAALPAVIAAVNGFVGVASGATGIAGSVMNAETKKLIGCLEQNKHERHINTMKIGKGIAEMKESEEAVIDGTKQMSDLISRQHEALRN